MREQLKQRLVGATVLVGLGVIVIPEFLHPPEQPTPVTPLESISESAPSEFSSAVVVVDEQRSPAELPESSRTPQPVAPPSAAARLPETQLLEEMSTPEQTETAPADPERSALSAKPATTSKSTQPAVESAGTWVVQLATFSKERNASDLQSKLRDEGYPVFLETRRAEKGELTRVYVGPLKQKDEAQMAQRRLEKRFKLKGIVLQRKAG